MAKAKKEPFVPDEVTPAQIDAGLAVLNARAKDISWPKLDEFPAIVAEIYQAMNAAK